MGTLVELIADAVALTGRPDKEDLIEQKINAACRLINKASKNWRDIKEVVLEASDGVLPTVYDQSITLPSDHRIPIYVDYPTQTGCFFTGKKLEDLLDKESRSLTNIFYVAGTLLHIRQSTLTATLLFGYYSTIPTLNKTTQPTNWIATEMHDVVVDVASHFVLGSIGEPSHSRKLEAMSSQALTAYLRDAAEALSSG